VALAHLKEIFQRRNVNFSIAIIILNKDTTPIKIIKIENRHVSILNVGNITNGRKWSLDIEFSSCFFKSTVGTLLDKPIIKGNQRTGSIGTLDTKC